MSRRSSFCATSGRSRGSISRYHTAESYWSVKHCACAIAFATTACNCGSRCWSAAAGRNSAHTSSPSHPASAVRPACVARVMRGVRSAPEPLAQELEGAGGGALAVLEAARFQGALAHHHAMRDAEQLRVGELDARPCVPVVVQHLDAGAGELLVQPIADFADTGGFVQIQRHQYHLERRNGRRPDDAALIVVLLDGGGHDARHTDSIAAHEQRDLAARFVEYRGLHGAAVLVAELEDVTHFYAAGD